MSGSEDEIISYVSRLKRSVDDHVNWRTKTTLNLLAAENFASEEARSFLSTDLSNRYTARDKFYRGTKYAEEVELLAVELAKKVYGAKFADVRPLSGHTCSLILFMSLLKPGDSLVTCPPKHGGYPGSSEEGLGPLLHLKNLYFPYDPDVMNIIPDKTKEFIQRETPELTVFGSSFIPFPYEIKASLPDNYDGVTAYDGSHVMGLIAGGEFQQPLSQGCSILMGSTHKTFFGPQGGLILSNDEEVFSALDSKVFPGIVDNIHVNRVATLAFALIELLKFGKQYARQVIKNSKVLASTLDELGVPVKCKSVGFTNSHQVLLNYGADESVSIADKLQELDIIVDVGIRVGTAEVTRRGMKENEMEKIGSIIADAVVHGKGLDELKDRVHKLVSDFSGIEYALN
jgi:glycine hydroxymethyltransferase